MDQDILIGLVILFFVVFVAWIVIRWLFRLPLPPDHTPSHTELIVCPQCGSHQEATVEHTEPWWSYVHWCGDCGACIGESEWENVKQ